MGRDRQQEQEVSQPEENSGQKLSPQAAWKRANREAGRAHSKVAYAIRMGRLTRPERCTLCDEAKPLDAHHFDYEKPFTIWWLCRKCHGVWDKRHRRGHATRKRKAQG